MFHLINLERAKRFNLPMPNESERKVAFKEKVIAILALADYENNLLPKLEGSNIIRESYLKDIEIPKTKENRSSLASAIAELKPEYSWKPSSVMSILSGLKIEDYGFVKKQNFDYFLAYLEDILISLKKNKSDVFATLIDLINEEAFALDYYWNDELGILSKKIDTETEVKIIKTKSKLNSSFSNLYDLGLEAYLKGYKGSNDFIWFESLHKLKEVYDTLLPNTFTDVRINQTQNVIENIYGDAKLAPSNFGRDLVFIVKNIHHNGSGGRYNFIGFEDFEIKWKFLIQIIYDLIIYAEKQKNIEISK